MLATSVLDVLEVIVLGALGFLIVVIVCVVILALLQLILPTTDSGAEAAARQQDAGASPDETESPSPLDTVDDA